MKRWMPWLLLFVAVATGAAWLTLAYWPTFAPRPPLPTKEHSEAIELARLLAWIVGAVFWLLLGFALSSFQRGERVFFASALSGVLLWLGFFPANLGPLAFVALVPFCTLIRAKEISNRRLYLAAWVGGLAFGTLTVGWVRSAHPMMALFAWPGISLFQSFWWPIALVLLRALDRKTKLPIAVTLPVVWVALEYLRAHFPTGYIPLQWVHLHQFTGFAWYFLGHTQHGNLPLIQSADLGGAYLVSAAVATINGAAFEWAVRIRPFNWLLDLPRGWQLPIYRREFVSTAGALGLVVPLLAYGGFRTIHKPFATGPRVALLQQSVPQNEQMADSTRLFNLHNGLTEQAANRAPKPDLIVWPEACYPFTDIELAKPDDAETLSSDLQELLLIQQGVLKAKPRVKLNDDPRLGRIRPLLELGRSDYAKKYWRTNVLLGHESVEWDGTTERRYNSARLIGSDGSVGPRYDKRHLVPFGEFVPFRETIPFLRKFSANGENERSCQPGDRFTRFTIDGVRGRGTPDERVATYRFGVLICYEDSEPYFARQYNPWSGGESVDFLVNTTNDGWFDGTEEHEQHLAVCRFRAVEARRSIVRAANMGITALIDSDGRVLEVVGDDWASSKKLVGTLVVDVPLDDRGSIYAALGDWLPLLCLVGLAAFGVQCWRLRKRPATTPVQIRPSNSAPPARGPGAGDPPPPR